MATNSELKPCPFCGGAASLKQCTPYKPNNHLHIPACNNCQVEMRNGDIGIGWFNGKQAAIDAWNRRTCDSEAHHEE